MKELQQMVEMLQVMVCFSGCGLLPVLIFNPFMSRVLETNQRRTKYWLLNHNSKRGVAVRNACLHPLKMIPMKLKVLLTHCNIDTPPCRHAPLVCCIIVCVVDEEVIHLLADYERDIGKRQRELEDIRKKKEELKRVEGMLKDLKV